MHYTVERVDRKAFYLHEPVLAFRKLGINCHGVFNDYNDRHSERPPKLYDAQTYRIDLFLTPYPNEDAREAAVSNVIKEMKKLGYLVEISKEENKS